MNIHSNNYVIYFLFFSISSALKIYVYGIIEISFKLNQNILNLYYVENNALTSSNFLMNLIKALNISNLQLFR